MIQNKRGFTLIEILVVVTLLAMTAFAITTSFIQGIKIYDRFNGMQEEEEKIFFIEHLTRDLKNGTNYSRIVWSASKDYLSFPSIAAEAGEGSGITGGLPVGISYQFNPERKEIFRTESNFPYDPDHTSRRVAATGIHSLKFDLLRDSEESMPSRVTVTLEYGDAAHPKILKKLIMIPVSYRDTLGQ